MGRASATREETAAIASGDAEAFGRFYERWFERCFGMARRCSGLGEDDCLDIVQEAMLRMIRGMRVFEDEGRLGAWVGRVVRSAAYDHLRRERRRARREAGAARLDVDVSRAGVERVDVEERMAWLRRELGGLDRATAEMVELRFRAGMTLAAVGARFGLKAGAVDGRVSRSVAQMRARAREEFDE
ncbi:MAG: sigma-70 family RNA polymerase sigma factor [Planctomycetota bacterium]|nr:sigma-70 family RNA polymerase sigma factor [Planctomycetota bacterium]